MSAANLYPKDDRFLDGANVQYFAYCTCVPRSKSTDRDLFFLSRNLDVQVKIDSSNLKSVYFATQIIWPN